MRVFVRGLEGSTVTIECDKTSSVSGLKSLVAERINVSACGFSISTGLRFLSDDLSLADCGIQDENTLFVNCELLGGGKKRKKKNYTKPKKIKHKKKKVKLAVLKYYKVDAQCKVSRLRKHCEAASCGPGIFLAKHENRLYCGRCGVAYYPKKGDGETKGERVEA